MSHGCSSIIRIWFTQLFVSVALFCLNTRWKWPSTVPCLFWTMWNSQMRKSLLGWSWSTVQTGRWSWGSSRISWFTTATTPCRLGTSVQCVYNSSVGSCYMTSHSLFALCRRCHSALIWIFQHCVYLLSALTLGSAMWARRKPEK